MTTKDAVYRELKYALAGAGGELEGVIEQGRIKMDVRITTSSTQSEDEYPWLIFQRSRSSEDNQVRYAKDQFEMALIGRRSSATKGDDLLEQIKGILIDHFAGKLKTWGKFEEDGTPDPDGGLKMKAIYNETTDAVMQETNEKAQILSFTFTLVRE